MTAAPRVALTFDAEHPDRPHHGEHAGWVLDELKRLGVRASIFLQGRWVEANPHLARRVADEGHVVGNHSFYHARMPLLSAGGFAEDIRAAEQVIRDVTGVDPKPWLRFPFGAGADEALLVDRLPALGYRHVGWDVEVYEWDPGCSTRDVVARTIEGVVARGDGAIVLLHTWPDHCAPALDEIVARLGADGWAFVGVDQLGLGDDLTPVAAPRPAVPAPAG